MHTRGVALAGVLTSVVHSGSLCFLICRLGFQNTLATGHAGACAHHRGAQLLYRRQERGHYARLSSYCPPVTVSSLVRQRLTSSLVSTPRSLQPIPTYPQPTYPHPQPRHHLTFSTPPHASAQAGTFAGGRYLDYGEDLTLDAAVAESERIERAGRTDAAAGGGLSQATASAGARPDADPDHVVMQADGHGSADGEHMCITSGR